MKSSARKVELASAADLFSTEQERQNANLERVQEIALSELYPFPDHPFSVRDDDSMRETVESIKESGVLQPAIARPRGAVGMSWWPDTAANAPVNWLDWILCL